MSCKPSAIERALAGLVLADGCSTHGNYARVWCDDPERCDECLFIYDARDAAEEGNGGRLAECLEWILKHRMDTRMGFPVGPSGIKEETE